MVKKGKIKEVVRRFTKPSNKKEKDDRNKALLVVGGLLLGAGVGYLLSRRRETTGGCTPGSECSETREIECTGGVQTQQRIGTCDGVGTCGSFGEWTDVGVCRTVPAQQGVILNVTGSRVANPGFTTRDEIVINVEVQNAGDLEGRYNLIIDASDGIEVSRSSLFTLRAGQTETITITSAGDSGWDISSLGTSYAVELRLATDGSLVTERRGIPLPRQRGTIEDFSVTRVDGDEMRVTVDVMNIGGDLGEYRVSLLAPDGSVIDREPDLTFRNLEPGERATFTVDTTGPGHDICSLLADGTRLLVIRLEEQTDGIMSLAGAPIPIGAIRINSVSEVTPLPGPGGSDEIRITVNVTNTSSNSAEFYARVIPCGETSGLEDSSTVTIGPGATRDLIIDSSGPTWDINDLNGCYSVEVWENCGGNDILMATSTERTIGPRGEFVSSVSFANIFSVGTAEGDEEEFTVSVRNTGNSAGTFFTRVVRCGLVGDSDGESSHISIAPGSTSAITVRTEAGVDVWDLNNCVTIELWEERAGIQVTSTEIPLDCCTGTAFSSSAENQFYIPIGGLRPCINPDFGTDDELDVTVVVRNDCSCRGDFRATLLREDGTVVDSEDFTINSGTSHTFTLSSAFSPGTSLSDFGGIGGTYIIRVTHLNNGESFEIGDTVRCHSSCTTC